MTSYKKLACFLSTILLLSLPMFGQYTTTYSENAADVLNSTYSPSSYNCVSDNCWVELNGDGAVWTQVSASSDGEVQAISSTGYRWRWNRSAQNWQLITSDSLGGTYKEIHVGSYANNNYLAITTASSGGNVYYWTGSAWAHLGTNWECATGSMDAAGDIFCIGTQGNTYQWTTSGWAEIRSADGVAITNNARGAVLLVNSSGNIYNYNGTGTSWTEVTGG